MELSDSVCKSSRAPASHEMQQTRQRIVQADPSEQSRLVRKMVAGQVGKTLGTNPEAIDGQQPLAEMGFDSLMGVELKNAIEAALAIEIPLQQLTAETSVRDLCEVIQGLLAAAGTEITDQAPAATESTPATKSIDEIERDDYDVRQFPEIRELQQRLTVFETLGIENPFFDIHEGVTADTTVIRGREMINFSSYNYLGSSGAPEVSMPPRRPRSSNSERVFPPVAWFRERRRFTANWRRPLPASWVRKMPSSLSADIPRMKPRLATC